MNAKEISITVLKGGFILTNNGETGYQSEVFTSEGKLIKAIRTLLGGKDEPDSEKAAD